jgi:hypothetical protein
MTRTMAKPSRKLFAPKLPPSLTAKLGIESFFKALPKEIKAVVIHGAGLAKGIELAERVATNAPLSNFAVMHALPRIAESDPASGLLTESLMAAIAQGSDDAKARLKDFLEKRGKKVLRG